MGNNETRNGLTREDRVQLISAGRLLDLKDPDPELLAVAAQEGQSPERVYLTWRRFWPRMVSGLFHGAYYSKQVDLDPSRNPMVHYLRKGYKLGVSPSPLVDIDFVVSQLVPEGAAKDRAAFAEFKRDTLSNHDGLYELLASTDSDPSPFFDNDYYRSVNDVDDAGPVPVIHYFQRRGIGAEGQYLETTPFASLSGYMEKYADLVAANIIPLVHLLQYGLSEGRQFTTDEAAISPAFLKNTATLYGDPQVHNVSNFVQACRASGQLAGPTWPSRYVHESLPSLNFRAPTSRRRASVGVVLFENEEQELVKLQRSIEREREEFDDYDVRVLYWANDDRRDSYEHVLGQEVLQAGDGANIGFGQAHNELMRRAFDQDDLYIGANPDGYFSPGCISGLIDFNAFWEGSALIEAAALPIDHPKWHDPVLLDTQWISGACFSISRHLWQLTGGFDPNIHLYCEDVDLSWRVRLVGGLLKVCPTARFFHDVTPRFSQKASEESELRRRRAMLTGDYYLSSKWGNDKRARTARTQLERMGRSSLEFLTDPEYRVDQVRAAYVADFTNARFAPSRFW